MAFDTLWFCSFAAVKFASNYKSCLDCSKFSLSKTEEDGVLGLDFLALPQHCLLL